MKKTNTFDVMVVYTENVATSSSSKKMGNHSPFALATERKHYDIAYAYFLTQCKKSGLKAAFTTSDDIIGPGTCKTYWTYKKNNWHKYDKFGFAPIIFDKVSPLSIKLAHKRDLLFSNGKSLPFNDPNLLVIFNDKLKTFKKLTEHTVPTVNITLKTVINSLIKLDNLIALHKNYKDFTTEFILKDRFGAGGIDIYKIGINPIEEITKILSLNQNVSFILQPFTKFDEGYTHNDTKGYTDIRIIYSQGKIVQRYIRTAKKKDFRCNEHQGGSVTYINSSQVPKSVKIASEAILKILNGKNSHFALDFIVSNNGNAYFLEGNINPGIYWSLNSYEDKINTKKLIRIIVKEIVRRSDKRYKLPEQVLSDHKPDFAFSAVI